MNILHIITGLGNGGAEKTLYRLVSTEKSNNHSVISLMDMGVYGEKLRELGYSVEALNMNNSRIKISRLVALFKLIRDKKPDVIQTWMYHGDLVGGVIGRMAGVKHIYWGVRGPYNKSLTPLSTKLVVMFCSWFSDIIPSAIVCNSQHAIKAHIDAGYNASRFIHIPNGYESQKYHSENLKYRIRQKLNLHPEKILLGMVARYDPYKDHETLLVSYSELIKSIQNTSLVLIGPRMDQSNKELEQLINSHNLGQHVYLLGPNDDIPSIMSCLDIHVLSSVDESFPNVVAEAMAVGTPCVTTDVGDAAYIVGKAGWVVPPSCPKGLKNGMVEAITLMQSRSSWIDLKTACRTRVYSEFSNEKMVGAYLKLWRQAVRG